MQGDRKRPIQADIVEDISGGIESLVRAVEDGIPYGDLEGMGRYVQWTVDDAEYEGAVIALRNEMRVRHDGRVQQAISDFRTKNGKLAEDVQWGWCPLWRVLQASKDILPQLPSLPWRHDGTLL